MRTQGYFLCRLIRNTLLGYIKWTLTRLDNNTETGKSGQSKTIWKKNMRKGNKRLGSAPEKQNNLHECFWTVFLPIWEGNHYILVQSILNSMIQRNLSANLQRIHPILCVLLPGHFNKKQITQYRLIREDASCDTKIRWYIRQRHNSLIRNRYQNIW
jgi:hypothetical protein